MPANSPKRNATISRPEGEALRLFSLSFGLLLGLSLLKFGNLCLFEELIPWPQNVFEWVLTPWPITIGYWMAGLLAVFGLLVAHPKSNAPRWVLVLPLIWLGWQFLSATQTIDRSLTQQVLPHFVVCVVCFYLGIFCLGRKSKPMVFWIPILFAMVLVVASGLQQHFGGLEETRRYFFTYLYPHVDSVTPEYLKKISSDRIFATLFYPNTLAGALLILLPPTMATFWQLSERFTFPARCFLLGSYGIAGLACLYWSGSKGGWLLCLCTGLVAALHFRFAARIKVILVTTLLLAGLGGFFWKYSTFFQSGATSVHARFDYWQAALRTALSKPVLGSGPATFGESYKAIKRPESEMARLAHNDYLEQASDSGFPGFAAFSVWMLAIAWYAYPRRNSASGRFGLFVWLGILGWLLHGTMEFGLYIPAISWFGFGVSGWAITNSQPLPPDKPSK